MGFDEIIAEEQSIKQTNIYTEATIEKGAVVEPDSTKDYDTVPDLSALKVSLEDIHTGMFDEFDKKNK